MNRPQKNSTLWWLKTGMLCHYLTDSFTGSHDEKRHMSLPDHRAYEFQLHDKFAENWQELKRRPEKRMQQISENVARMRKEYEEAKAGVETDCRMIITAVRGVIGTMAADAQQNIRK